MKTSPTVSVLMSVYDDVAYIARAIESIRVQTFLDFECIIVNDGSPKETSCILDALEKEGDRFRIIKNSRRLGLTASLNIGLRSCTGKYIVRMDADDIVAPDRIEKQVAFMETHRDVGICGSQALLMNDAGNVFAKKQMPLDAEAVYRHALWNNPCIHSSWCVRKEVFDTYGAYDETFRTSQDYEFLFRVLQHHEVVNLSEELMFIRMRRTSVSWRGKRQEWDALRARYRAIRRYDFPFFRGMLMLTLRFGWFLVPQFVKRKRYAV